MSASNWVTNTRTMPFDSPSKPSENGSSPPPRQTPTEPRFGFEPVHTSARHDTARAKVCYAGQKGHPKTLAVYRGFGLVLHFTCERLEQDCNHHTQSNKPTPIQDCLKLHSYTGLLHLRRLFGVIHDMHC